MSRLVKVISFTYLKKYMHPSDLCSVDRADEPLITTDCVICRQSCPLRTMSKQKTIMNTLETLYEQIK